MTFRLHAHVRAGEEILRGIISLSKLLDIQKRAIPRDLKTQVMPSHLYHFGHKQLHIEWDQWSSAASIHKFKSAMTARKPRDLSSEHRTIPSR